MAFHDPVLEALMKEVNDVMQELEDLDDLEEPEEVMQDVSMQDDHAAVAEPQPAAQPVEVVAVAMAHTTPSKDRVEVATQSIMPPPPDLPPSHSQQAAASSVRVEPARSLMQSFAAAPARTTMTTITESLLRHLEDEVQQHTEVGTALHTAAQHPGDQEVYKQDIDVAVDHPKQDPPLTSNLYERPGSLLREYQRKLTARQLTRELPQRESVDQRLSTWQAQGLLDIHQQPTAMRWEDVGLSQRAQGALQQATGQDTVQARLIRTRWAALQHNLQLQQHLERLLHTLQLSGDRKAALHEQILELQRPVDRCPSTTPPQPNDLVNEEEQQPTAEQQAAEQGPQETALGDDAGEGEGGQGIATPSTVDSGRKVRSEKHFPRSINTSTAPVFRMTELFQSRRPWSSHPRKGKPELNNDATRLIPLMRLMPASFPFRVWHPTEDESLCKELLKVGKAAIKSEEAQQLLQQAQEDQEEDAHKDPMLRQLHRYAPCIDALDEAAWARVAAGVITDRGPSECRLRWLSHFHPEANRAQWSAEVDDRLLELVGKYKERNWHLVAEELGMGFNALDCLRRYQTSVRAKAWQREAGQLKWDRKRDALLVEAVRKHGEGKWQAIGGELGCAPSTAMYRWRSKIKPSLHSTIKKGPWHKTEDQQLKLAVEYFGMQWTQVARMVDGRTDAQCRERWCNVLDPSLKDSNVWEDWEDAKLLELCTTLVSKNGTPCWGKVARQLPGRVDVHVKRRYVQLAGGVGQGGKCKIHALLDTDAKQRTKAAGHSTRGKRQRTRMRATVPKITHTMSTSSSDEHDEHAHMEDLSQEEEERVPGTDNAQHGPPQLHAGPSAGPTRKSTRMPVAKVPMDWVLQLEKQEEDAWEDDDDDFVRGGVATGGHMAPRAVATGPAHAAGKRKRQRSTHASSRDIKGTKPRKPPKKRWMTGIKKGVQRTQRDMVG